MARSAPARRADGTGLHWPMQSLDVVHEGNVARFILAAPSEVVWAEVLLALKVGELLADAVLGFLGGKGSEFGAGSAGEAREQGISSNWRIGSRDLGCFHFRGIFH